MATDRTQIWLQPPVLAKLERARTMLGLEAGEPSPARTEALELVLDRFLASLVDRAAVEGTLDELRASLAARGAE